jgi:hypothetical protein
VIGRYQVVHPDAGLVGVTDSLADALALGDRCAEQTMGDGRPAFTDPFAFEVYDRLARRGCPRTWQRTRLCGQFVKGDRLTTSARWWCKEIRPETEPSVREQRARGV